MHTFEHHGPASAHQHVHNIPFALDPSFSSRATANRSAERVPSSTRALSGRSPKACRVAQARRPLAAMVAIKPDPDGPESFAAEFDEPPSPPVSTSPAASCGTPPSPPSFVPTHASQLEAPPVQSEVPLRATGASPAMRRMMGVFRIDPFALHDGVHTAKRPGMVAALAEDENEDARELCWNGEEVGPLKDDSVVVEFQVRSLASTFWSISSLRYT
jgi:hypothetical protein